MVITFYIILLHVKAHLTHLNICCSPPKCQILKDNNATWNGLPQHKDQQSQYLANPWANNTKRRHTAKMKWNIVWISMGYIYINICVCVSIAYALILVARQKCLVFRGLASRSLLPSALGSKHDPTHLRFVTPILTILHSPWWRYPLEIKIWQWIFQNS